MRYGSFSKMNKVEKFTDKLPWTLSPLQIDDMVFTSWEPRTGNFSEVGAGKTVVSTGASLMAGSETTLVLVPPILVTQWCKWLRKFTGSVVDYRGTPGQRKALKLKGQRWVVMTHGVFRKDFNRIEEDFIITELEIIVDEAQALKNVSSVLYKYVARLSKDRRLQLLTGTPTSQPTDAYAYIKLKTPSIYRTLGHFESLHIAEKDYFGGVTEWRNLDQVRRNLALSTVKRTKEELFGYDLKPIFPDGEYELSPQHMKLYNQLVEEQLLLLPDDQKIDATTSTRLYHAMQQIVVNWDYFSGDDNNRSTAFDIIDQVVEETNCMEVGSSKLIIWTWYTRTTQKVLNYLNGGRLVAVGAYSGANSNKSFEAFQDDPSIRVLVASPASAGAGLNPQAVCSEMLWLETPTTPLLVTQGNGRVDRQGQTKTPRIVFATAKGTIQEYLKNKLISNDDLVSKIEDKKFLRLTLLGG